VPLTRREADERYIRWLLAASAAQSLRTCTLATFKLKGEFWSE
jgi:hypothetical protein